MQLFVSFIYPVKKCSSEFMNSTCPLHTRCKQIEVEHQSGVDDGDCLCDNGYIFNPKYTGDADYCTSKNDTTKEMTIKINRNSDDNQRKSNEIGDIEGTASAQFEEKIKTIPRPHHIVAGVVIPIAFVIIVVSVVFAYKKLHITQHIRNVRRTHRNRPFYEDVMLGSNDNDDPPLI